VGVYKLESGNSRGLPAGIYYINPAVINTTGRASEGFGTSAFNGQVFFNNSPGQTSGLERAVLNGPWFVNMDASLAKNFRIKEGVRFQLRLEGFNVFNHTNFQDIDTNVTDGDTFGTVLSAHEPRIIQLGLKLTF